MAAREADPVAEYVAELSAGLHGPRRAKQRMLTEIGDGLRDAAADHGALGHDPRAAVACAVAEFGRPEELLLACRAELTIRQIRATSRMVALGMPLLLFCWYLMWIALGGGVLTVLAVVLAAIPTLGALLATALLLLTGRPGRGSAGPRRLSAVAAWTATVTSVSILAVTALLAVRLSVSSSLLLPVLVALLTVALHGVFGCAARACRRCGEFARA